MPNTGRRTTRTAALDDGAAEFLRRRVSAAFDGAVTAKQIAENIAFGAAVLGAGHIELVDHRDWWFVASPFNWLRASKSLRQEAELFEKLLPFPEQSPSGHRAEIYVTLFAADAYLRIADEVIWILGEAVDPLPDDGVTPPWCDKVVAFRLAPASVASRAK